MMSLPFFGLFVALAFVGTGHRTLALVSWIVAMVALALLFRAHATDPLNIVL